MEIRLKRNQYESAAGYTHARLITEEGGFLCWTLEDENRGLHQDMPITQIERIKVKGKTAIPSGRYEIEWSESPKFKSRKWAKPYGGVLPFLKNVPGFSRVCIHVGNTVDDTDGCILVGMLKGNTRGRIFDSTKAFYDLMDFYLWPARKRNEKIYITIE